VFLDAFVPSDGQGMLDVIPPDRRPALEAFVEKEGDGWLLPRFAPPPWKKLVTETWQVADDADLNWILPRLRPTPFGHFREPVKRRNPAAEKLPRTYVRTVAASGLRSLCAGRERDGRVAIAQNRELAPAVHYASN
jgi:hypothetical protein